MDRIEMNPHVCAGKPVIRGTRIPVTVILDHLAEGMSREKVLEGFPMLCDEDISAAIAYASRSIESTDVVLTPEEV
ncbi:MAG: DUF433 domain-containing protein [Candidatus Omnitrophica bacterium]|nr:DUF433 domain-containing protein [Candidatus Omnitrophota bacterium]MCA9426398.1 DUF433 domain-containing protein [Candidatus Omnitrophota bacterium]MCA9434663.1 DUF433 domain-containing protein [Candidatus Omnitrophota bacterium]MCA9449326.1 DUF433 domain-containing protein [Candidatus Omnitrophota bacterium]MCB9768236.1 DUF433 domain-containing protein [Candidatus Omnitrophota bacterium]